MRSSTLVAMLGMLSIVAASPGLAMRQKQADQGRGGAKTGQGQGDRKPSPGQGNRPPSGGQNPIPPPGGQGSGQAPGFGGPFPPSTCALWSVVAADLVRNVITGSDGNLSAQGRSAIRLVFHDCFPQACDGSIILAGECDGRAENLQLTGVCRTLGDTASRYRVGTADIIQLAGALAVRASGGPALAFKTGRADSRTANPAGQLPGRDDAAARQVAAFAAKGFTAAELVVLVGAHTVGRAGPAAAPMDATPNRFDNAFYNVTAAGRVAASLNSDRALAWSPATSPLWRTYAGNGKEWRTAFAAAMAKLSIMGNKESSMEDCSTVVTGAFSSP